MKTFAASCIILIGIFVITYMIITSSRYAAEYGYFEGQKDALNGDIRIKHICDSCYVWTKSPHNSGKKPKYHDDCLCN
jgi:hypothetical protein